MRLASSAELQARGLQYFYLSTCRERTEYPAAIRDLIAQLRQMPGVGPRSAERIALWMVRARGDQPEQIARAITHTRQSIQACTLCGFFAASEICEICADPSRSTDLLCVTEQPTDILPLRKDRRIPRPISFARRQNFPARSYRPRRFANQRITGSH